MTLQPVSRFAGTPARMARVARGACLARAAVFCGLLLAGCAQNPKQQSSLTSGSPTAPPKPAPAMLTARTPARVISTETWTFGNEQGRVVRTDSYRLFTTQSDSVLNSRLPTFMEEALQAYTGSLGNLPRPPVPLDTYLMANRPQWTRLTQSLMGKQADIYLKIQRGGFTAQGKAVLYDIGTHDTFSLIAHEGWHQYTQRTFRQPLPT